VTARLFQDPGHHCLKVDDWPDSDQVAWMNAIRVDHVLDDPGPASHWSPATIHKNRRGYGRWLTFLRGQKLVGPDQDPAGRVTRTAVGQYLALLESQDLAPYTVVARIDELRAVMAVMAPGQDWRWLTKFATRLRRQARPVTDKRSRLVPTGDLFELGLSLMETTENEPGSNRVRQAVQYRDGLMIAFLAARPVRLSNLASMRLGTQIIQQRDGWALVFEAHEMKGRQPYEVRFPQGLEDALETYLEKWRPLLLRGQEADRLWITKDGRPMKPKAAYDRITKVTLRTLGKSLNPHLFRDCAATSIALDDPEHVRIIPSVLGHSSLSTSEKHYNQARSLEAGRRYQSAITDLRRKTCKPGRLASKG
jgi:integrase/recombinase XerD